MSETCWLTRAIAPAIHAESVRRYGGSLGLRDRALLESAPARPRNLRKYEPESDLAARAAAYGFGLARNHAFVLACGVGHPGNAPSPAQSTS